MGAENQQCLFYSGMFLAFCLNFLSSAHTTEVNVALEPRSSSSDLNKSGSSLTWSGIFPGLGGKFQVLSAILTFFSLTVFIYELSKCCLEPCYGYKLAILRDQQFVTRRIDVLAFMLCATPLHDHIPVSIKFIYRNHVSSRFLKKITCSNAGSRPLKRTGILW